MSRTDKTLANQVRPCHPFTGSRTAGIHLARRGTEQNRTGQVQEQQKCQSHSQQLKLCPGSDKGNSSSSVRSRRRACGRMTTYLVEEQQAEALPQDRSMYDMVGWLTGWLVEQQGQIHSFITSTDGKERPCTCLTYHNSNSACYNVTMRMSVSGCLQVNNPCLHLYPCSTQISRFKL